MPWTFLSISIEWLFYTRCVIPQVDGNCSSDEEIDIRPTNMKRKILDSESETEKDTDSESTSPKVTDFVGELISDVNSEPSSPKPADFGGDVISSDTESETFCLNSGTKRMIVDDEFDASGDEEFLDSEEEQADHSAGDDDESQSSNEYEEPSFITVADELERNHVKYPNTGDTYIFWKSHNHKPSSIDKHCNDLLNISESNRNISEKFVLVLIVDDGADYGIRGPTTTHFFGLLFRILNLDALFVVKNARETLNGIQSSTFGDILHLN